MALLALDFPITVTVTATASGLTPNIKPALLFPPKINHTLPLVLPELLYIQNHPPTNSAASADSNNSIISHTAPSTTAAAVLTSSAKESIKGQPPGV